MKHRILTTIISPHSYTRQSARWANQQQNSKAKKLKNIWKKRALMILMIPKRFSFVPRRTQAHFGSTSSHEKIAFDSKDPFFNDDGSETKRKKKEKVERRKKKDSLEFTDTTECLQWKESENSSLKQLGQARVIPFSYVFRSSLERSAGMASSK